MGPVGTVLDQEVTYSCVENIASVDNNGGVINRGAVFVKVSVIYTRWRCIQVVGIAALTGSLPRQYRKSLSLNLAADLTYTA